jgi:hypothetical protein
MDNSVRAYCKQAKLRMKSKFWQDYKDKITKSVTSGEYNEIQTSKVVKYYQAKAVESIRGVNLEEEAFYIRVKELLKTHGEVSDAIGRLTDKEYYDSLSYEQKQRYLLDLSSKYLKAKERYYKELEFEKISE